MANIKELLKNSLIFIGVMLILLFLAVSVAEGTIAVYNFIHHKEGCWT